MGSAFLESTFICAVDLFVMITGYFMCTTNHQGIIYDKLIGIVYKKISTIDELSWDVSM